MYVLHLRSAAFPTRTGRPEEGPLARHDGSDDTRPPYPVDAVDVSRRREGARTVTEMRWRMGGPEGSAAVSGRDVTRSRAGRPSSGLRDVSGLQIASDSARPVSLVRALGPTETSRLVQGGPR